LEKESNGWVILTKVFKNVKMIEGGLGYLESWYIWGGELNCNITPEGYKQGRLIRIVDDIQSLGCRKKDAT
jgi:hypothetical protein